MDGTLIDSLMFWGEMWRDIGKRYFSRDGFKADESLDLAVRTMLYADALELIQAKFVPHCKCDKAERKIGDDAEPLDLMRGDTDTVDTDCAQRKGADEHPCHQIGGHGGELYFFHESG